MYSISGFGKKTERSNTDDTKCTFCGGNNHSAEKYFKRVRQEEEKFDAAGALDNRQTKRTPWKCFRYGSQDHLIAKFLKPLKNEKLQKQVPFNKNVNHACNNGKNTSDQNI